MLMAMRDVATSGEWNHFLYLSKIAFGGWAFHFRKSKRLYCWTPTCLIAC